MHLHFLMNQTVWTLDPLAVIKDLIETHVKGTNSTFHLNLSWKTGQWKTNPYILFLHKIDFCVFQTHFLRTVGELCISVWKNSLIKVVIKQQMKRHRQTLGWKPTKVIKRNICRFLLLFLRLSFIFLFFRHFLSNIVYFIWGKFILTILHYSTVHYIICRLQYMVPYLQLLPSFSVAASAD